jgi:hypothetical protein
MLLGLKENNQATPDIEGAELKAHRTDGKSLISLFTFNRKAWQMKPLEAIKKYGSYDKDGRLGLYYTMSLKPNSAGLFIHVDDLMLSVRHISGDVLATWKMQDIMNKFIKKIPSLILVSALVEKRDGIEYFYFNRVQLMEGSSPELIADQFREENILVDLRLHDQGTRARNHGTGFRIYENNLPKLFKSVVVL